MYSHQIYQHIQRWLTVFERSPSRSEEAADADADVDVILYGLGRFGSHLADRLSQSGHRVLAIDFDPHKSTSTTGHGVTAFFGSAEDIHLLDTLPLTQARAIISAIATRETNLTLLHNLRHHEYRGVIALTAHTRHDADLLRAAGADTVLQPFAAAATTTSDALHELLTTGRPRRESAAGPGPRATASRHGEEHTPDPCRPEDAQIEPGFDGPAK